MKNKIFSLLLTLFLFGGAVGCSAGTAATEEKGNENKNPEDIEEEMCIRDRFAPQRGSEKFIHDGQNVHHIEHEVIEHHQNDAKSAQKIQFPEPLFALFRKARDPRPEIIRFYSVVAHSAL